MYPFSRCRSLAWGWSMGMVADALPWSTLIFRALRRRGVQDHTSLRIVRTVHCFVCMCYMCVVTCFMLSPRSHDRVLTCFARQCPALPRNALQRISWQEGGPRADTLQSPEREREGGRGKREGGRQQGVSRTFIARRHAGAAAPGRKGPGRSLGGVGIGARLRRRARSAHGEASARPTLAPPCTAMLCHARQESRPAIPVGGDLAHPSAKRIQTGGPVEGKKARLVS